MTVRRPGRLGERLEEGDRESLVETSAHLCGHFGGDPWAAGKAEKRM